MIINNLKLLGIRDKMSNLSEQPHSLILQKKIWGGIGDMISNLFEMLSPLLPLLGQPLVPFNMVLLKTVKHTLRPKINNNFMRFRICLKKHSMKTLEIASLCESLYYHGCMHKITAKSRRYPQEKGKRR